MLNALLHKERRARVSLPRERFWDIPVPKIDSPTRANRLRFALHGG
ncbi:MAG: hypothetical protein AB2815_07130 [Candidatus Sedimenticola endophacoides]